SKWAQLIMAINLPLVTVYLLEKLEEYKKRNVTSTTSLYPSFLKIGGGNQERRKIESLARMSNMSQEDVATGLRTVQQGLEALRDEHSSVCTTLESSLKGISEDEAPMPREKHHQISDNVA
ncbi:hypothetical protein ANCCEY_15318, partial [Ancylostoma ceylanicum]